MAFRPPFWLPTNPREPITQPPLYRFHIHASQAWFDTEQAPTQAADYILHRYFGHITNHIQRMRHARDLGIIEIIRDFYDFEVDGRRVLTSEYRCEQGREIVEVTVYPESLIQPLSSTCIVVTNDAQIIWSTDGKKWTVDADTLRGTAPAYGSSEWSTLGGYGCSYDVITRQFLILQLSGLNSSMFRSSDGNHWAITSLKKSYVYGILGDWNEWKNLPDAVTAVTSGTIQCFEQTGLIWTYPSWSSNGGATWNFNTAVTPSSLFGTFLQYPAPLVTLTVGTLKTTYVVDYANGNLINVVTQAVTPIIAPITSGSQVAAGNGVLIGFSTNPANGKVCLTRSTDNLVWAPVTFVVDILSTEFDPLIPTDVTSDFTQIGGEPPSIAQLIFAPSLGKFVLAANKIGYFPLPDLGPAPVTTTDGIFISTARSVHYYHYLHPVSIYTSSDGLEWEKVFTAPYSNGAVTPFVEALPYWKVSGGHLTSFGAVGYGGAGAVAGIAAIYPKLKGT